MMRQWIQASLVALVVPVFLAGCGGTAVQSSWRDTPGIAADGSGGEWEGRLHQLETENTAVGVYNDSEALYMALVPWSQARHVQIAGSGCILWFRSDSDDVEPFGIHFPRGDKEIAAQMIQTVSRSETLDLIGSLAERDTTMELLDGDFKVLAGMTLDEAAGFGVRLSLGEYQGHMMVEARIPWAFEVNGRQFRVAESPGTTVTIQVQTPTASFRERMEEEQERAVSQNAFMYNPGGEDANEMVSSILFRYPIDFTISVQPAPGPGGNGQ